MTNFNFKWSNKRTAGMYSWCYSDGTWSSSQWRIQIYWPEVKVKRGELHIVFRTILRLVWNNLAKGFGVQLFGFGCGVVQDAEVVRVAGLGGTT